MNEYSEPAQIALKDLFAGPLSERHFRDWVRQESPTAEFLRTYAFGEIFWSKSIGRPQTPSLSEGFTMEAWREEEYLKGAMDGPAHWETRRVYYYPSWWDGPADDRLWRVSFVVPNLQPGRVVDGIHHQPTYVVPRLVEQVSWRPPGRIGIFAAGLRLVQPGGAMFIKDEGPVRLTFEVVMASLVTFDADGIAQP